MGSCDIHGGSWLLPNGHNSNGLRYDATQDCSYWGILWHHWWATVDTGHKMSNAKVGHPPSLQRHFVVVSKPLMKKRKPQPETRENPQTTESQPLPTRRLKAEVMVPCLRNYMHKSLLPYQKFVDQHNNLKGVSTQSRWIDVPLFNAAGRGTTTHSHVGHWHINLLDR
jgi:hypothetical protein